MTAIEPCRDDRALAQVVAGGVAADIRAVGNGHYALALAGAASDCKARLVGTLKGGGTVELGALEVAAGSKGAAHFPVVAAARRRIQSVYLEIVGDDLHLRCAAPPLPPPRGGVWARTGAVCLACGALVLGGSFVGMLLMPIQLAAPGPAVAGQTVQLAYATRSFGDAHYRAVLDDGTTVAADALANGSGSFGIPLPAAAAGHQVRVELDAGPPFVAAKRAVVFGVTAPPAVGASPRIGAFAAGRERAAGESAILASYLVSADAGEVTVTDEGGTVVAQAPISHLGSQRVALPAAVGDKPLGVRLDVRRGAQRASTTLRLAAAAPPSAVPAPVAGALPALASAGAAEGNAYAADDPFAVLGRPVAGHPFAVAIRRGAGSMHLRLEDDAGNPVDELDVPAGAAQVQLHAPSATTGNVYYVNCFYETGGAQELVVRPVSIAPR